MTKRSRQINFLASPSDVVEVGQCIGENARIFSRSPGKIDIEYRSLGDAIKEDAFLYLIPKTDTISQGVEFTNSFITDKTIMPGRFYLPHNIDKKHIVQLYEYILRCVKIAMPYREGFYYMSAKCKDLISEGYKVRQM